MISLMSIADGLRKLVSRACTTLISCVICVLQAGPIPKHIAFIMDGNRRFAKKQGLQSISGHQQGYLKVLHIVDCCVAVLKARNRLPNN